MKLYHGSIVPVNEPDLKHSKPYKDFGRGFYLSADRKQAVEMGEQKLSQIKQGSVYVSTFHGSFSSISNTRTPRARSVP